MLYLSEQMTWICESTRNEKHSTNQQPSARCICRYAKPIKSIGQQYENLPEAPACLHGKMNKYVSMQLLNGGEICIILIQIGRLCLTTPPALCAHWADITVSMSQSAWLNSWVLLICGVFHALAKMQRVDKSNIEHRRAGSDDGILIQWFQNN